MGAVAADLGSLAPAVRSRLELMVRQRMIARIWDRDPTVWKRAGTPEIVDRLGWLDVASRPDPGLAELERFAGNARDRVTRVVLCGMGGSSLAPEVLWRTLGPRPGWPALTMLDTTHPAAIAAADPPDDRGRTLYVISSKSGTTQETSSLLQYFWERSGASGGQFVAVTDPGTPLARLAAERGFAATFLLPPDIGGRYSALSPVGTVPAALIGLDARELLRRGEAMATACGGDRPVEEHPGAWLGAVLGEAALAGRNKLTFLLSPRLSGLGLWLEQLVAESTGKEGKGIVPVVGEPPGEPAHYANDRLFVRIDLQGALGVEQPVFPGHPSVCITLADPYDLGAEFFRWEFATAVASAILGVNAFDQPNVAESKANTRTILGRPPEPRVSASPVAARRLLGDARGGEYVALLAFVPPSGDVDARLTTLQGRIRDRWRVAVTAGYGPRYLHSTGQLHKGGPANGRFVLVVPPVSGDLAIPGEPFSFGRLLTAQAEGDFQALARRGRPVIWLDRLETLEEVVRR